MKKTNIILLLFSFVFLIVSLASCGRLSSNQAMELIRKAKGYPKSAFITFTQIRKNSPLGQEIARLVKEGYLANGNIWTGYEITEKGKDVVSYCDIYNSIWHTYNVFRPITYKEDVIKIKKILTDSKSGTAQVTYEVGFTPTPYFYSLKKIDEKSINEAAQNVKPFDRVAIFKKYDQGWQYEGDQFGF